MSIDIRFFEEDATIQLQYIEDILSDLQSGTKNKEKICELFRAIHTLKGAADMFGFRDIVSLTHKAEDLLGKVRDEKVIFDSNLYLLFIDVRDILETLINIVTNNITINKDLKKSILNVEERLIANMKTNNIQVPPSKTKKPKKIVKKIVEQNIKTILVVDDSSMIRSLAQKTAEAAGYNVVTAEDGQDGLAKLKDNKIDFVFSDVNMPQMGGMEMVKEIRKKSKYEFLPIVMLTTEKKDELKAQGKALGVKAWLVKPFNKNKLLMVLEKLLA